MAKELIINASLPEVRIALMEDGRIQELLIERESDKGIVGNIYKGRVTRVLPGMQAAFVDVGLDKAAFLYVDDIYVHPKVMGEETEVVDEEDDHGEDLDEDQSDEPRLAGPKPEGAFIKKPSELSQEPSTQTLEMSSEEGHAETTDAENTSENELDTQAHHDEENESENENEEDEEEQDESDAAFEAAHELESEGLELSNQDQEPSFDSDEQESDQEGDQDTESQTTSAGELEGLAQSGANKNARGGRGRNRNRKRGRGKRGNTEGRSAFAGGEVNADSEDLPENFQESVNDGGQVSSDRAQMEGETAASAQSARGKKPRPEFREQRGRDRRIKTKHSRPRAQANISDLLKEGQEVIVQIAKDPIATKGARLTCHVSLPGRHLVCMPSIDHVGVSRRIERDDERRKLRDFVEKNRPRKMGFIVRTASGGKDPESWIKQDIDYLSKLWNGIRSKADDVSAPALVYEDLNSILRAIRDWVNEDIDKIIVDSRYHYNELQAFADRFMPALHEKLELYHGDVPIFDAYGISSELHRSLERKVWLKSGGSLVIDQAEALVAIDVNTGRYVGKKSLEDTILKTNIEAAEEIAHQLRLRNCGGIIICDFIDMEREDNRMRVYRALDEALKKDRARPTIQKISELGLVEMTRKRTRDTVIRTLCEPCTHCEGKGFVKSTLTVAYEILREIERLSVDREAKKILVSAHETVINALAIELRDALDQLERRYNKSVYLQTLIDFHTEQFEVVTDRAPNKKATQDIARQLRVERERSDRKEKNRVRKQEHISHRGGGGSTDVDQSSSDDGIEAAPDSVPVEREKAPVPPTPKPSGAFVTARGTITPKVAPVISEKQTSEAVVHAGEESGASDEDAQPSFSNEEVRQPRRPSHSSHEDEINDEDQLAYLRAQAAQDAAIAGLSQQASNGNRAHQNRNRGEPQQNRGNSRNNRNQRGGGGAGGGGRYPNANRGGGNPGNQRFKPHHQNGNGNLVAPQTPVNVAPAEPQIPDYEVISRNDGSDS